MMLSFMLARFSKALALFLPVYHKCRHSFTWITELLFTPFFSFIYIFLDEMLSNYELQLFKYALNVKYRSFYWIKTNGTQEWQSTVFSFIDSWVCSSNHKPFKILDEIVPALIINNKSAVQFDLLYSLAKHINTKLNNYSKLMNNSDRFNSVFFMS